MQSNLSPCSRTLFEKLRIDELVKMFPGVYGTGRFINIRVLTNFQFLFPSSILTRISCDHHFSPMLAICLTYIILLD
jgi:hypothetical protein